MTGGRVNKCFFGVLGGFLPQLSADCDKWSQSAESCGKKPPKTPKKHLLTLPPVINNILF